MGYGLREEIVSLLSPLSRSDLSGLQSKIGSMRQPGCRRWLGTFVTCHWGQMDLAAWKTKLRRTRKSKFLLSQAEQNALLPVCFPQWRGKTRWRMRSLSSAALGSSGEHLCPPCAPPSSISTRHHQNWVLWGHSVPAVLGAALWTSTYTAIFTSKALPGGCVFSPCSRTGLAVPSCCWLDLSLKLELVQSVLLTLKSGTYTPAQNSSSSHRSHFPELGEEWEQLQVAMAPGVGAGDIPGARASFVTLTATIRVPTWLNWVLTSRRKIPLGITASQHGTIIGLTSFSVYITS